MPMNSDACPENCNCSDKSIICTCEHMWHYEKVHLDNDKFNHHHIVLSNFSSHLEYVESIVIYGCDSVTIREGTFSNLKVRDNIKFVEIKKLRFEKNGFLNILASPRQLVIQECGLSDIPSFAFTGLSHMNHFWIRNSSVTTISKLAFSGLKHIDYLYFRQTSIANLEPGAFAHMTYINKFFIRDQIILQQMGEHLFIGTQINEVIFEKVNAVGSELFLIGLRAKKILLKEMKMQLKAGKLKRNPTQDIGELKIINCSINRLVVALFYNYTQVLVKNSHVNSVRGINGVGIIFPYNISSITFEGTRISHIHAHAFKGSRSVERLNFISSRIEHFHSRAFEDNYISFVAINSTIISVMGPHAFNTNKFETVILFNTTIAEAGKEIFYKTSMNSLTLQNCTLPLYNTTNLFGAISEVDTLAIQYSTFTNIQDSFFSKSNIKYLQLTYNTFTTILSKQFFRNLDAETVVFQFNELFCDPGEFLVLIVLVPMITCFHNAFGVMEVADCGANALLTSTFPHNLAWRFENNNCNYYEDGKQREPTTGDICSFPNEFSPTPGLICQNRWLVDDCTCLFGTNETYANHVVKVFPSQAQFLLIGDCRNLVLVDDPEFQSNFVHFYRIDQGIKIESVPASIKRLHFIHSDVSLEHQNAFKNRHLQTLIFENSLVTAIDDKVFYDMYIEKLTITESSIRQIERSAFKNSIIREVDISNSHLKGIGNLFESAQNIIVRHSTISTKEYETNKTLATSLKRNSKQIEIVDVSSRCSLINSIIEGDCDYFETTLYCSFEKNSKVSKKIS
uniref:Protein kinase domain-containing protein n=1 Tax=Rhabditophanes sp. KR3021 TaxID=114890 RepID=A0AC35TMG3_9BILA